MAIFGSNIDDSIDQAMQYYKQGSEAATQELQGQQQAGETAIRQSITGADVYTDPYRQTGEQAVGTYAGALGLGGAQQQQEAYDTFTASPGYQWATDQATQGIQRNLASRGLSASGAEQKELARYITGAADQEYQNWLGGLQSLTGTGQTSAEASAGREASGGSQIADLGYGYGTTLANVYTDLARAAGEAELAGALTESQQTSGLIGALGSVAGAGLGYLGA